jgi:hypothetical protein
MVMILRADRVISVHLAVVALASALTGIASAQSPTKPPTPVTAVGTWRGTSTCLVRPSACHDEIVVYRIRPTKSPDSLTVDALKIVGGEEQGMGVLGCRLVALSGHITCAIPHGVWHFTVRNDSLTGELRLPDNTRFRDVRATRTR